MVRKKRSEPSKNLATIENEYVHSLQQKKEKGTVRKKALHRRLTVFSIVAVVMFSILTYTFVGQKKVLAAKLQEEQKLKVELIEHEEQHLKLTAQLEKLNDDEYIAKLARQEYFLSDKNEIIFSLPKSNEKGKKKEDEKE